MTKLKSRFMSEATAPPAGRVSSGCISKGYSHPNGPPGMSQMIHCMLLCTLLMRHVLGRGLNGQRSLAQRQPGESKDETCSSGALSVGRRELGSAVPGVRGSQDQA